MHSTFLRIILIFTMLPTVTEVLSNPSRTAQILRTTLSMPSRQASNTALSAGFFDLAGTIVDRGCKAPVQAFLKLFNLSGINLTETQARTPMGKDKLDHLKELLAMQTIHDQWVEKYGRAPDQNDLKMLYDRFLPIQKAAIEETSQPISGLEKTLNYLDRNNIQVGFNTGYPREMATLLEPFIIDLGYDPDSLICANEVEKGRPAPDMLFENASKLGLVDAVKQCFAVGDTPADIKAGKNAGMWTIAVALTGNETGLNESEMNQLTPEELESLKTKAYASLNAAEPNFVVDGIWDLDLIIPKINILLANGHEP